ncbi:hypothetical protein [Snodgrassella gandavensis]|nr:hypothetical protein [Snodgrassella gandavensis]
MDIDDDAIFAWRRQRKTNMAMADFIAFQFVYAAGIYDVKF